MRKVLLFLLLLILVFLLGATVGGALVALIHFLNTNSGAIIAIATIALVAVTYYLAQFNQKLWLAQDKPWLSFTVKVDNGSFGLHVRNIGKGSAFDINFKFGTKSFPLSPLAPTEGITMWGLISENKELLTSEELRERYTITEINYEDVNGIKIGQKPVTLT